MYTRDKIATVTQGQELDLLINGISFEKSRRAIFLPFPPFRLNFSGAACRTSGAIFTRFSGEREASVEREAREAGEGYFSTLFIIARD